MLERKYSKRCDSGRLTLELINAGYPMDPNPSARFYGVLVNQLIEGNWETIILCYDNLTDPEKAGFDAIVVVHIPTPLPVVEQPKDEYGKPYVRAESRPLACTTYFTSCGDTLGASPVIGSGNRLAWNASVSEGWVNDENGAPSGMKQFSIIVQFCDSIWLKEGALYYMNCSKGSYGDMEVLCPHGGYYMYLGQVYQNTTGYDLVVDHYLMKHPLQGDVPMGDELNTESCSQELPSYLKFRFTVTVPEADVTSYGAMELEMFRCRTVVI